MKTRKGSAKLKSKRKQSAILLKCRNCGYVWRPDPRKWTNHFSIVADGTHKMLKCPSCGTPNRLTEEMVHEILA